MEGISICITAYKAKDYIKETLDSVENQTYFKINKNFEVLVGIDACTETLEYLKTIQHNYQNLRVFMMDTNKGTYVTTNTLISIAKYDNIIRFDSDDIMLPNMVETIMKQKGNSDIYRFYLQNFGGDTRRYLSDGVCFFKRSFLLKYGGYQPWKCSADSEMKIRLAKFGLHGVTSQTLFLRRIHNNSLTRKNGETKVIGGLGSYRQEKINYVRSLVIRNEKDATIKFVTNTYTEIFTDKEYQPVNLESINEKINEIQHKKTSSVNRTQINNNAQIRKISNVKRTPKIQAKQINDVSGLSVSNTTQITDTDEKLIVTLTTWKGRINNLPTVLGTILKQSKAPDRIVINLSSEEFAGKENDFDEKVVDFLNVNKNIIQINWVDGPNTKQWKKILPTLKLYPNDCIVCVDDDFLYPSDMLETLWAAHLKYPNNPISGNRVSHKGYQCQCGCASLVKSEFLKNVFEYATPEVKKLHSSDIFFTYVAAKGGTPYVYCGKSYFTNMKKFNEIKPLHNEGSARNALNNMWNYLVNTFGNIGGGKKKSSAQANYYYATSLNIFY